MIRRQAYDSNTDKEESIERALQILARAGRFQRAATDSRLSAEDRQQAQRKTEEVMQEFADHCMSYSLRSSDIKKASREGSLVKISDIPVLLETKNKL
jgi:hypothetical protein